MIMGTIISYIIIKKIKGQQYSTVDNNDYVLSFK